MYTPLDAAKIQLQYILLSTPIEELTDSEIDLMAILSKEPIIRKVLNHE